MRHGVRVKTTLALLTVWGAAGTAWTTWMCWMLFTVWRGWGRPDPNWPGIAVVVGTMLLFGTVVPAILARWTILRSRKRSSSRAS